MTAKDFINIDSDVITTELPTDEDIINDILISVLMLKKKWKRKM